MSFTPRGASVPTRFMFTRSGDSTRSAAVESSTPAVAEIAAAQAAAQIIPVFIFIVFLVCW